jgi:hypothetical protein
MSLEATTANPFRHPLRRKEANFKTSVWQANEEGKDSSAGKTDFAVGDEYVWLAFDFSVPLRWVTAVEERGPGFLVAWENPINHTDEAATFCVRTMFGYDRKRRDEIVKLVNGAVVKAKSLPQPQVVAAAETTPRCEVCGARNPGFYEFQWMTSVAAFLISKPDRRVLCPHHAKWRTRRVCLTNLITSNLGFGAFVSPIVNFANVREGQKRGGVRRPEAYVWIVLGSGPYIVLATLVGWAIWFAITF